VFFIGDRFYGTITAFVPGADAANYHFTSALAAQLLKSLAPEIQPLIDGPSAARQATGPGAFSMISAHAGDATAIGNSQPIPPAIPLKSPQPTLRAR
jgi:hypothetical protein